MAIISRYSEIDIPKKLAAGPAKVENEVAAVSNNEVAQDIDTDQSIETSGTTVTESPNLPDSISQEQTTDYIKSDTFEKLFSMNKDVFEAIKKNMREVGFDKHHPIILVTGPWTTKPVVGDGHTRLKAALDSGIEPIFVTKTFLTEDDAFFYVVHEHRNRRNLSDAEKVNLVIAVDKRLKKGGDTRVVTKRVVIGKPVRSSDITAEKTGVTRGTVEKIRTITAKDTPSEIKEAVDSGKTTINKAYNEIVKANRSSKGRKQKPSENSLTPPVIGVAQSTASTAPSVAELPAVNNDVAVEKRPSVQTMREMVEKAKSFDPEYDAEKILEAGVYFRKFDGTWGPMINRINDLPVSSQDTFFIRFEKLVRRIEKEARQAAQCAARNLSLFPDLDLTAPIIDEAKGTLSEIISSRHMGGTTQK